MDFSLLPEGLTCRYGRPEDHQAISGLMGDYHVKPDYVEAVYMQLAHSIPKHIFVMERQGKVVAFVIFLVDDSQKTIYGGGARVSPSERGQGLIGALGLMLFDQFMRLYPGYIYLGAILLTDAWKRNLAKGRSRVISKLNYIQISVQRRYYSGNVPDITSLSSPGFPPVAHMGTRDAINTETTSAILKLVSQATPDYFLYGNAYFPCKLNAKNMVKVLKQAMVFVSKTNNVLDSVSMAFTCKAPEATILEIYVYGPDVKHVISHVLAQFRHTWFMTPSEEKISLQWLFPECVDSGEVAQALQTSFSQRGINYEVRNVTESAILELGFQKYKESKL